MGFDPSGNFTRLHNWQQDRTNGIRILADRHDAEDDNFANGFNQTFLRNGVVPMTGPLNMGGKKITTIAAGTALLPGLTFELSLATGLYQENPNSMSFSCNGVKQMEVRVDAVAMPFWTVGRQAALNNGQIVGTGDYPSIVYNPNAWAGTGMQMGAGVNKGVTDVGNYGYINVPTGKIFEICVANAQVLEANAAGAIVTGTLSATGNASLGTGQSVAMQGVGGATATIAGFSLIRGGVNNGNIIVRTDGWFATEFDNQAFKNLAGSVNYMTLQAAGAVINVPFTVNIAGVQRFSVANTSVQVSFGASGGTWSAVPVTTANPGFININVPTSDPGVQPAILNIRSFGGLGGGAGVSQYGIKCDMEYSANGSGVAIGIYGRAHQGVGGPAYGMEGASSVNGNSTTLRLGVHGTGFSNSDLANLTAIGIYGDCQSVAGTTNNVNTAAGYFYNACVRGNQCFGVYINAATGPTSVRALEVDYASTPVLYTQGDTVIVASPTTAAAANVNLAATPATMLRSTSALRYKRDVKEIEPINAHRLRSVRPIQFKSKSKYDDPNAVFYGFVAEEVEEAGLAPLVAYAFQEDQYEKVETCPASIAGEGTPTAPTYEMVPKVGEVKRPDGVQYERVVVLQQLLINELYERLEALEGKL